MEAVEEFPTSSRAPVMADGVLATVLFTDILGSTEKTVALGGRRWRDLLDGHNKAVRAELTRFRGHEAKSLGDGFLATFSCDVFLRRSTPRHAPFTRTVRSLTVRGKIGGLSPR